MDTRIPPATMLALLESIIDSQDNELVNDATGDTLQIDESVRAAATCMRRDMLANAPITVAEFAATDDAGERLVKFMLGLEQASRPQSQKEEGDAA